MFTVLLGATIVAGLLVATVDRASPAGAVVPDVQAQVNAAWNAGNDRGERNAVAVYDRVTGQFWGAGDYGGFYASASVVKVAIATQLLVTGQMSGTVEQQAYSMITRSDDDAADALYGRVGGDSVMPTVAARYGLSEYFGGPTAPGWWGLTQISARGIVLLYDKLANDPVVAPWLLPAMAAAQCTAKDGWPQCSGLPSVAAGWRVKQGWMCCLDGVTRMHSTGYVNGDRYTVALLTEGSRAVYSQYGRDTLTIMAQALMPGGQITDPHQPYGWLDLASAAGSTVTLRGWASDPDAPTTPLSVDLYLDGRMVQRTTADRDRPDVAAAGYPGHTGFLTTVDAGDGPHTVCAYALNVGDGSVNPQLNCLGFTVTSAPFGYLDRLTPSATATTVRGWAIDPSTPSTPLVVHIYVDGVYAGQGTGDQQRDDVVAATSVPGAHGFQFDVPTVAGRHTICAYAINTGPAAANSSLGCLVGGYDGNPSGAVETTSLYATWLRVAGWVRDPDATGAIPVDVWADGHFLGETPASSERSDGTKGFSTTVNVPAGTSTVTAYAINVGPGTANPAIGSLTVTGNPNPVGYLDTATRTGSGLTVAGWAADPDLGDQPDQVDVYVDGRYAATLTADGARDGLTAATGIPGSHGFTASVPAAAGPHSVCAYAINAGAGTGNPSLGCLSTSG